MLRDAVDAAHVHGAGKSHGKRGQGLENGNSPFSSRGPGHGVLAVVVLVVDYVGVVVCAVAGEILVADIVVEARAGEKRSDRRHVWGGVLDSLGDGGGGDSGLGRDGHDENVRKDGKTCVEI